MPRSMRVETKFPVVLIHGLFGYGKIHPFWNQANPYWPEDALARINSNHLIVEVGAASSDYDRACEVFFALTGGTVDYGEAHALEADHARFGRTFETALHPLWSAENPVHLLGHSCGSTTALELYQLVCDDAFGLGTDHRWVRSIICIAGPLSGSTLTHLMGVHNANHEIIKWSFAHWVNVLFGTWFKLTVVVPWLTKLYDLRMPQWQQHTQRFAHMLSHRNQFYESRDGALHALVPSRRVQRNSQMKYMDQVFLLSIATSPYPSDLEVPSPKQIMELGSLALITWLVLRRVSLLQRLRRRLWWLLVGNRVARACGAVLLVVWLWKQLSRVNVAKLPTLWGLMWLMRRHSKSLQLENLFDGFEAEVWEQNDGLVNVKSMIRPWFPPLQKSPTVSSLLHKLGSGLSLETVVPSELASSLPCANGGENAETNGGLERNESHLSIDTIHRDYSHDLLHTIEQDTVDDTDLEPPKPRTRPNRFEKGIWYVNRVAKNHFCGMWWDNDAFEMYHRLFTIIQREFEQPEEEQ